MNNVEKYYDLAPNKEWDRLEGHRLEFELTKKNLIEFISKPSTILDLGGGPGRYSILLAKLGHRITLVDISQNALQYAKTKADKERVVIDSYIHANATDLSMLEDEVFDVVLCMGPMYHLIDIRERRMAIEECRRVLKPNGLLFCVFVTRYAPMIAWLRFKPEIISKAKDTFIKYLRDGINIPKETGFTDAYFVEPSEVKAFMDEFKLKQVKIAGIEGLALQSEFRLVQLSEEDFQSWVDLMYQISTDPFTWGASEHLLYIGCKCA